MTIWIDADASPKAIKEIVFRASARLGVPVILVANRPISIPKSPHIRLVRVPGGPDAADDYIAGNVRPKDIVITADIPLAAKVVATGARAIDPRGEIYDASNVAERLSLRDFMEGLRGAGLVRGGPPQLGAADRKRFAGALDRLLARREEG